MTEPYNLNAFARERDGSIAPFTLVVRAPQPHPEFDYCCWIECQWIRESPMKIFGWTEEVAYHQAMKFVQYMLSIKNARLVSATGEPIKLPVPPEPSIDE